MTDVLSFNAPITLYVIRVIEYKMPLRAIVCRCVVCSSRYMVPLNHLASVLRLFFVATIQATNYLHEAAAARFF